MKQTLAINIFVTPDNKPPLRNVVHDLVDELTEHYHLDTSRTHMEQYFVRGGGQQVFLDWIYRTHGLRARVFDFSSTTVTIGYGLEFDYDENLTAYLLKKNISV